MSLRVLHYNCRGLTNEERMTEFETALDKIKWDVVGTSEIRKQGEGLLRRNNGNHFYYFGETKGSRGGGYHKRKIME